MYIYNVDFLDQGDGSYIHNPLWDLTPFQKYQLKKGLIKVGFLKNAIALKSPSRCHCVY